MLNEFLIENKDEIVLDSTNNVFVGPDKYFKIVIDDFDGKVIKAWHIEDSKGNKTENLADRAQGKHIDVLVNQNCRTVSHFSNRIQSDLYKYQQNMITKLTAQVKAKTETPAATAAEPAKPTQSSGVPVAVPVVIAVIAIAIIAIQAYRNNKNKSA